MKIEILWEDNDMMVVNKPPGVVVNRAESVGGETVADWIEDNVIPTNVEESLNNQTRKGSLDYARDDRGSVWDDKKGKDGELFVKRSGIAHRLDKETSGCLLIAKNPTALVKLLGQFKNRVVKKEYWALVHGRLAPGEGTIRLPLQRSRFDRERFEIHYGGKAAETGWKVEKYYDKFTLVRLFPLTGRTHQIRVHLSHLGYPIFADERYLNKNLRRNDRERLSHHFLHAQKIGFKDIDGGWHEVAAPLPSDSLELLSWMENG